MLGTQPAWAPVVPGVWGPISTASVPVLTLRLPPVPSHDLSESLPLALTSRFCFLKVVVDWETKYQSKQLFHGAGEVVFSAGEETRHND